MRPPQTVCAFVLTRNRKVLLGECVRAVLAQRHPVDRLIVLDNASTDGTEAFLHEEGLLDDPRVRLERREVNTGGAGGYREGLRLGIDEDRDWIWLMDDDAEPRPDALERLLAAAPAHAAAVCTSVLHPDGRVDVQHRCRMGRFIVPLPEEVYEPGRRERVTCASFVGLLVRTTAARRAGLPVAEMFLGYDDAEYSLRLREHGDIVLVPEAQMLHKVPIGGGGAMTRRAAFLNRRFGLTYAPVPWEAFWRDLYRVRNFMWIKQRHGRLGRAGFWGLTAGYVVKSLLYDPQPLRRVPWIVRFAVRGRRGDWSAPSPEDWARGCRPVTGR